MTSRISVNEQIFQSGIDRSNNFNEYFFLVCITAYRSLLHAARKMYKDTGDLNFKVVADDDVIKEKIFLKMFKIKNSRTNIKIVSQFS